MNNQLSEKKPYLEIYKNKTIVLKIWENIDTKTNLWDFLNYINFLKNKYINIILLDEKWQEIFKVNPKNNFLNEIKETQTDISNILLLENNKDYILKSIDWKEIEFLSKNKLKDILEWNNKKINVEINSQLFIKLQEIYWLLNNWYSKITLTNIWWLKEELEWFGSGTMFINLEKSEFKKLNNLNLFKQIYKKFNNDWNWKKRSIYEVMKISKNYNVLELDWTILWWYYLSDFNIKMNWKNEKWKLLENLFSSKNGWGIWYILWEKIKKEWWKIFAYSKQEKFFSNLWFEKIKWQISKSWAFLWKFGK